MKSDERVMAGLRQLYERLRLKVNEEKRAVAQATGNDAASRPHAEHFLSNQGIGARRWRADRDRLNHPQVQTVAEGSRIECWGETAPRPDSRSETAHAT